MFLKRVFVSFLFFSTSIEAKSLSQTYAVLLQQEQEEEFNEKTDFQLAPWPHHNWQSQMTRIINNMSWVFSTWVIGGNILLFVFSDSVEKIKNLQELIKQINSPWNQYEVHKNRHDKNINDQATQVIMALRSHFQFSWLIPGSRQVIGLPSLLEALKQLSGLEIAQEFDESTKKALRDILDLAQREEKPWYIESWASHFMPSVFTEGDRTYF